MNKHNHRWIDAIFNGLKSKTLFSQQMLCTKTERESKTARLQINCLYAQTYFFEFYFRKVKRVLGTLR